MILIVQNIIRFILLVFVQVLVLNNIQFLGYLNPYLYILFILALPVHLRQWIVLLLAFALGLTIDAFSNTMGLHAFATVFMAFLRLPIIKLFATIDEGVNPSPSFRTFGILDYLKYAVTLVLMHHVVLFFLEAFTFAYIGTLLIKILLSSLVTILLTVAIQLLKKE
jgi:rod shape-determining protein MreD